MKDLYALLEEESRGRAEAVLTEEEFRHVLDGVAPIFRERSLALDGAVPRTVMNDPGVLKSRHLRAVDVSAAEFNLRGTGGLFDGADKSTKDVDVYALFKNIEVPWRQQKASERNGGVFNLLRESGALAAGRVVELENTLIVDGLGSTKGISTETGIQTFASEGAWTTADIAYRDVVKAVIDKFGNKKVPRERAALLASPTRLADLYARTTAEGITQLDRMKSLLPGGIRSSIDLPDDKAYVYANTPTVLEYVVYQDTGVFPLPMVDEDPRVRVRICAALHIKKVDGIVEITSIDA